MKKRAPTIPPPRTPPSGDVAVRRAARLERDQVGNDAGLTIVAAPQFDALLTLLDDPPAVPDDLRREIAGRRWA